MYKRIMVVDDDEVNNFVTEKFLYLMEPSCKAVSYTNPVEAWQYLQEQKNDHDRLPEIILLDINMPAMDGFEFLENLVRENFADCIQVIMYSSSTQLEDKSRARNYENVIGYMEKPFCTDTFQQMLVATGKVVL